ncbi:MAG: hypothetical protein NVS4B3_09080 [Gemmatimonadaceae bacterium]
MDRNAGQDSLGGAGKDPIAANAASTSWWARRPADADPEDEPVGGPDDDIDDDVIEDLDDLDDLDEDDDDEDDLDDDEFDDLVDLDDEYDDDDDERPGPGRAPFAD